MDDSCRGTLEAPPALHGFPFAMDWLEGCPSARALLPDDETQLRAALISRETFPFQAWGAEDIAELEQFNRACGNHEGSVLAGYLAEGSTLAVVTGQQPNFLASPLYILYKALAAVARARELTTSLSRRVIPVFWVASDDDDFEELRDAQLLNRDGAILSLGSRLSRGKDKATGSPAYLWDTAASRERIRALADGAIPPWAERIMAETPNFELMFCRLLVSLLGPENPMLFVVPRLNAMRKRQARVLLHDLDNPGLLATAVNGKADEFTRHQFPVPMERDAAALNFFWLYEGVRHRLVRQDDRIVALRPKVGGIVREFSADDLGVLLETVPENFIPNVVTRPAVQDLALPALVYVAGPGEIAYLAQARAVAGAVGVAQSAVALRTSVTLVLTADGNRGADPGIEKAAEVSRAIAELEQAAARGLEAVFAASGSRPHLKPALAKTGRNFSFALGRLKDRASRQLSPAAWRQARLVDALKSPLGKAQERTLSPLPFTSDADPGSLSRWLMERVDFTSALPQEIDFSAESGAFIFGGEPRDTEA